MKYEFYENIQITDDFTVFNFVSEGKKGSIPKRVVFTETEWDNVYNLGFGDVDEDGEIDDLSVSDNGDRNKVLATVVLIAEIYIKRFPERWIFFRGSTMERTRLYRMAIGRNLQELSLEFDISVYVGEKILPFDIDLKINAFLIKRKKA